MSGFNNWSRPDHKPRPPGLRGRAIGLYFRHQQLLKKAGKISKEDFIINFQVPPAVIVGLENNIKSIMELASQCNIPVTKFKGLNSIKKEEKRDFSSGAIKTEKMYDFSSDTVKKEKMFDFSSVKTGEDYDFSADVSFPSPSNADSAPSNKSRKIFSISSPSTSACTKFEEFCHVKQEQTKLMAIGAGVSKNQDIKIKQSNSMPMEVAEENTIQNKVAKSTEMSDNSCTYSVSNIRNESSQPSEILNRNKIKTENTSNERLLSLRGAGDFKYGYEDIITGSFDEKLDECLSNGITITKKSPETDDLCLALYENYKEMVESSNYQKYITFRESLPTCKKSKDLLHVISNNKVIVISGETGCGKSTQVPQLILDDAIKNMNGGYVKILVTQPRRIAASSLAMRVAQERGERVGTSVGYAVRLERRDPRPRGSIFFCTTGILLSTLEIDQGLTNYTHVILDEVHERDCDIDLAMFMLKKVLQKRTDLKLILMSATIDAESLSEYFNNCPMLHIEGLAFPVKDIYLEEILEFIKFRLPSCDPNQPRDVKHWHRYKKKRLGCEMEKDIQYKAEIAPWLESVKSTLSHDVYRTLQNSKIEELNFDIICDLMAYICKGPPGGILVFLPGITDISKLLRQMRDSKMFPCSQYDIYHLHSKLPSLQQHKIFETPPENKRKIVIATNIAETSITIDDIVYVIDCGRMKYTGLNIEDNVSTLQTEWISQANLRQRRGRAGRCQPGICYHLLTSFRANQLEERLLPEMQRNNLLEPVLSIKRLRLGEATKALSLMPGPPNEKTVLSAVRHLQQVGALDYAEKLTPLGWHLARLPVHPAAGKLMLFGALFGCLNRAVSVAAVWGFKDPFHLVIGKEHEVDAAKKTFALGEGSDHVVISEAIMRWEEQPSREMKRNFAAKNFMTLNTLELLSDMKKQFGQNLKQMGFLPSGDIKSPWENRNNDNLSLFKAIVAAALYPNIAPAKWKNANALSWRKVPTVKAQKPDFGFIDLHPSSVMAAKHVRLGKRSTFDPKAVCRDPGANWLVYWQQQHTTELYLFEVTLVHTLPLLFFGELTVSGAESSDKCFITIASIKVRCETHTAELLFQMRLLLDQVLASKIGLSTNHATEQNPFEEQVLNAVKELITAEDERARNLDDDDDKSDSDSEAAWNTQWRR